MDMKILHTSDWHIGRIEFLLSPNRLNVAISRAQWACYILRSPHLAIMEPTSPDGMVMLGKFVTLTQSLSNRR